MDIRDEEYQRIRAGWRAEFEPEGYQEERLIEILVLNDWHLHRAQQRLIEAELNEQEPEQKQRFTASLERAFYRAWSALQKLRKEMTARDIKLIRNEAKIRELEAEREGEREAPRAEACGGTRKSAPVDCRKRWTDRWPMSSSVTVTAASGTHGPYANGQSTYETPIT